MNNHKAINQERNGINRRSRKERFRVPKEVEIEVNIAKEQKALNAGVLQLGEPPTMPA